MLDQGEGENVSPALINKKPYILLTSQSIISILCLIEHKGPSVKTPVITRQTIGELQRPSTHW